jgi:hypothetical protein
MRMRTAFREINRTWPFQLFIINFLIKLNNLIMQLTRIGSRR